MTPPTRAERVFEGMSGAVHAAVPPAFDAAAGRARFLATLSAGSVEKRRRYAYAVAAAAALVLATAIGGWRVLSSVTFRTAAGEGHAGAWLATGDTGELPLRFSEGTEVVMAPDSRGRVQDLARSGASFLLERGAVRARVVHRAWGTNWRFLAGPFEVRVTGTALGVDWDPARERFAVRVDEGAVAVRGPTVAGLQVVRAGEECVVDLPSRTMQVSPVHDPARAGVEAGADASASAAPDAPSPPRVQPANVKTASSAPAPSWTTLEARGDFGAAYAAAAASGLAGVLRASSADELLRFAVVARLSGHGDTEREALVTCRRRFPCIGARGRGGLRARTVFVAERGVELVRHVPGRAALGPPGARGRRPPHRGPRRRGGRPRCSRRRRAVHRALSRWPPCGARPARSRRSA